MLDKENSNKKKYFRIHIDEHDDTHENKKTESSEKTIEKTEIVEKRTIKEVFQDGLRQIIASLIILVIGFFLLKDRKSVV